MSIAKYRLQNQRLVGARFSTPGAVVVGSGVEASECARARQLLTRSKGVGIGYMPPLWDPGIVDEIVSVRTDDAKEMDRKT